jgi:hypothetical protein
LILVLEILHMLYHFCFWVLDLWNRKSCSYSIIALLYVYRILIFFKLNRWNWITVKLVFHCLGEKNVYFFHLSRLIWLCWLSPSLNWGVNILFPFLNSVYLLWFWWFYWFFTGHALQYRLQNCAVKFWSSAEL